MLIYLSMIDTEDEKDKFILVYEKYKHLMWYIANGILKDEYLAEDAVSESFIALTRHLDKVGDVASSATRNFMATIVKSKAIDIVRKNSNVVELELDENLTNSDNDETLDNYINNENYVNLLDAIRELDDIYRVVFEYKYLHGLSEKEIAKILGISPKTVNVRVFRARKKLQEILV